MPLAAEPPSAYLMQFSCPVCEFAKMVENMQISIMLLATESKRLDKKSECSYKLYARVQLCALSSIPYNYPDCNIGIMNVVS